MDLKSGIITHDPSYIERSHWKSAYIHTHVHVHTHKHTHNI